MGLLLYPRILNSNSIWLIIIFVKSNQINDINKDVCDVLMLNFGALSKMCSLRLLRILQEPLI
jgi:hypothetical protein